MEDDGFTGRDGKDVDDICTTLFEAYLREARNGKKEERGMWETKAKSLLTDRKVPTPIVQPDDSYPLIQHYCYLISHHSLKEPE